MPYRSVRAFLEAGIDTLMPQAQRLLELRTILSGALPPNLRRSCAIANYLQGKVVIFAENSAVAAKLKLLEPNLRANLMRHSIQVTGITIRVQPKQPPEIIANRAPVRSESAARCLLALADQLPDSKLKTALSELAARHRE